MLTILPAFLLTFLTAQVQWESKPAITLEIPDETKIESIAASHNKLFVPNDTEAVVHVFDLNGKLLFNIGGSDSAEEFIIPYRATWIAGEQKLIVYDSGKKQFLAWKEDGTHLKTGDGDFDMFFTSEKLEPLPGGFLAPISVAGDKLDTIGWVSGEYRLVNSGYPLASKKLADFSPDVRRTFIVVLGETNLPTIIAAQALSPDLQILNADLSEGRKIDIEPPGWESVNIRLLDKVNKNPVALRKLKPKYSEIVALEELDNSVFLVAFRNVVNPDVFTYQLYRLSGDSIGPLGEPLNQPHRLVEVSGNTLYLAENRKDPKTIYPFVAKY